MGHLGKQLCMMTTRRCAVVGFISGSALVVVIELIIICLMAREIWPPDTGDILVTFLEVVLMALVGGAVGAGISVGLRTLRGRLQKRSQVNEAQPKD